MTQKKSLDKRGGVVISTALLSGSSSFTQRNPTIKPTWLGFCSLDALQEKRLLLNVTLGVTMYDRQTCLMSREVMAGLVWNSTEGWNLGFNLDIVVERNSK